MNQALKPQILSVPLHLKKKKKKKTFLNPLLVPKNPSLC